MPPSPSRAPAVASLALALGLTACSEAPADAGWEVTVDTLPSGAVHVVNRPPSSGIAPTWALEPELTVGSVDEAGPTSFGLVKGVAPLADGGLVVLDAQAQELRLFAPDGGHRRTFGGKGEGPGELQDANGLLVGPDGLIRVNDPRNARLSLFHPEDGFVGSERLEIRMWGFLWDATVDSTNRVHEVTYAGGEGDERWRVIKVYDPQGVWTDTVRLSRAEPTSGDAPGVYRYERGMATVPFWPRGARALDPRGFFWSKGGQTNDYRIARTTLQGDTLLVFESRRRPLPVSAAERDSAIGVIRERAGRELDWSRIPAEKPVVEGLFLDDRGSLWVRVRTSDPGTAFDVFDDDGRYEGTVTTDLRIPSYWTPVVRGDRLYTLVTDELDVPYAVRASIVRARS